MPPRVMTNVAFAAVNPAQRVTGLGQALTAGPLSARFGTGHPSRWCGLAYGRL